MRDLRDKRALITGGAAGIGRALALRLAREGTHVYLLDIDEPRLAETVAEARTYGVEAVGALCDLSQPDQIAAALEELRRRWGHVDILVNNAGLACYGRMLDMPEEEYHRLLAVNLHAPLQITRALLPTLLARPEAHVVNMASVCGLVASGRMNAYHVSKYALLGFSEALRAEFCRRGVGVTAVCPGPVRTDLLGRALKTGRETTERAEAAARERAAERDVPAWLCSTPEEVAERTLTGIYWNSDIILVGWLAWWLYYLKRLCPWLIDLLQTWSWGRPAARAEAESPQLSASSPTAPPPAARELPPALEPAAPRVPHPAHPAQPAMAMDAAGGAR